jgi:anti-sigma factor RsiW
MDCRHFRNQHLAFLDDSLPDAELVAMQRHLTECEACARHDTAVRRGLLLFRNQPSIEPSANFAERLAARLDQARREVALQRRAAAGALGGHRGGPGLGAFAAAAAGVVMAGYLVTVVVDRLTPPETLALDPVVATQPEPRPPTFVALPSHLPTRADVTPAVVASVATGMPLWPTVMMTSGVEAGGVRLTSLTR